MRNEISDSPTDPRIYLAAERTFLTWIRTGITLVVAGMLINLIAAIRPHQDLKALDRGQLWHSLGSQFTFGKGVASHVWGGDHRSSALRAAGAFPVGSAQERKINTRTSHQCRCWHGLQ